MFNLLILTSLVCVLVCASRFALSHHQRGTDFGHEGGFGGPYLCAPSNSARVQNRFEFVELGRDMSSNCAGEVQARTGISGWYQLVPRTHYIRQYRVCRLTRGSHVQYQVRMNISYDFFLCFFAVIQLFILYPPLGIGI